MQPPTRARIAVALVLAGWAASARAAHHRCGWIGASDPVGVAAFVANASWFQAIHPDWYKLGSDGVSVGTIQGEGDPKVIQAAAANGVALMPMVAGVENVAYVRTMLNDPSLRAEHVQLLVDLAVSKGYAGLDIDYEGLWQASDRAPYDAFLQALSSAMHQAGKLVSADLPGLAYDVPDSAWDYVTASSVLDVVHLEAYDFHGIGTHAGPVAPLGWVDAIGAYAAAHGPSMKFSLGVANFGVTPSWFCATTDCVSACGGSYATTTSHMKSCPFGHWDAGRAPNCNVPKGHLYFEDTPSMQQKVQSASAHALGGIVYWTTGKEPAGFFTMVKSYY